MLTSDDMIKIAKEAILNIPPTLTSEDAITFRREIEEEVRDMHNRGIMPDLPHEWPG